MKYEEKILKHRIAMLLHRRCIKNENADKQSERLVIAAQLKY